MAITVGVSSFLTLSDLIGQAREADSNWEVSGAIAFLVVLLHRPSTTDSMPGWESEFTRPSSPLHSDDLPGQNTIVIPLRPGPSSTGGRISLGRSSICDVVLPFPSMSKVHAFLMEDARGAWSLEDAGSLNGTTLNGAPVLAKQRTGLDDGAELKFGDVEATFWMKATLTHEVRRQSA